MGTIQQAGSHAFGSRAKIESPRLRVTLTASGMIELVQVWYDRSKQRRALQALTDCDLKDIGLSRADVAREAMKPFWQE